MCDVPADVSPMKLKVDEAAWLSARKHKLPPRQQSRGAQEEIQRQIRAMEKLNIIKESSAPSWLQVFLVPKPNNRYRFCQDLRALNGLTVTESWPIPNIEQLMLRLGGYMAKYFGVMDLTAGYHQVGLHPDYSWFTAFKTFCGLYEWLRITMGLKGAPSYFQQMMSTVVLVGLIYTICEVYLDDVIVFGKTDDEFISNLRQVFLRFRERRITVNPDKTRLGLPQVEYVGHLIDGTGMSFTRDRINTVVNLKKPQLAKELKTFIGLANYFHRHIRDMSSKIKVLELMLPNYRKNSVQPLEWTELSSEIYDKLIHDIKHCPKLFFLTDGGEIILETDASDYGIGAYLYQLFGNEQRPINFISKALSSTQLKWSPYEKEAYAIYYAFRKLEYLLRDVQFALKTDHKNLIYVTTSGSPKVLRWKMEMQTYNFTTSYFPGPDNVAADALSRLCSMQQVEDDDITERDLSHTESFGLLCSTVMPKIPVRIPSKMYKCISAVHNSTVGHFGVELTHQRLGRSQAYKELVKGNPDLDALKFVRLFTKQCPCCQKMSYLRVPLTTKLFTTASHEPMRRLNIDAIGPLPVSRDGCEHILVIIDTCTRFVELYPIKDVTAYTAFKIILSHVGRYGIPNYILSDRGPQFVNEIIGEMLKLLRIEQQHTIPYSKEENAIVERANREVLRHLPAFLFDQGIIDDWDLMVPLVQRIVNSKVHETLGVSPAQLLFGNAINLDNKLLYNDSRSLDSGGSVSELADRMLSKQKRLFEIAVNNQLIHDQRHLVAQEEEITSYPINSLVLLRYPPTKYGNPEPNKLSFHNAGPFRIVGRVGVKYTLIDLTNFKEKEVHISRLVPYYKDGIHSPEAIANKDKGFFEVEKVISHKGTTRNDLQFLVKWLGYDNSENSYVAFTELKNNALLHKYLLKKKMGRFIPKSLKYLYSSESE